MLAKIFLIVAVVAVVRATNVLVGTGVSTTSRQQYSDGNYAFSYDIIDEQGATNSRSESGDARGNVQGSYSLRDTDGRARTVDYVADKGGYRAVVKTNEPGTAKSAPASVVVDSPYEMPVAPEVPVVVEEEIPVAPVVVATPAPVTSTSSKFTIIHSVPHHVKVAVPVAVVPVARPQPVAHPVAKFSFLHHAVPHVFAPLKTHPFVLGRPFFYPRHAFGNYKGSAF